MGDIAYKNKITGTSHKTHIEYIVRKKKFAAGLEFCLELDKEKTYWD